MLSNKNIFLTLTSNPKFWDKNSNRIHLGSWCVSIDDQLNKKPDNVIENFLWDKEKKIEAVNTCFSIKDIILPYLTRKLNSFHKVDHTTHYWDVLCGAWLIQFIQVIFHHYTLLKTAVDTCAQFRTIGLSEEDYVVPRDFDDFVKLIEEDAYNLQLFSQILELMGKEFERKKWDSDLPKRKLKVKTRPIRKLITVGLSKFLKSFTVKNNFVIFSNSYLNMPQLVSVFVRSKGKVVSLSEKMTASYPEINRAFRSEKSDDNDDDPLVKVIRGMLLKTIPYIYVESYNQLRSKAETYTHSRPKAIVSSIGYYTDEIFKAWAAQWSEAGVPLYGIQHGGNYGSHLIHPHERFERGITDFYCTWGWDDSRPGKAKLIKTPSVHLSSGKSAVKKTDSSEILFITHTASKHFSHFNPRLYYQQRQYLTSQLTFFGALPDSVLKTIRYRRYMHSRPVGDARFYEQLGAMVQFDDLNKPFKQSLAEVSLVVCDHLSTTFLESLTANKPTLLFWNPDLDRVRPEAQPYYDQLAAQKILHYSPESAAQTLIEVYDNFQEWWMLDSRQEALTAFNSRFGWTSSDIVQDWSRFFHKILSTGSALE